MQMEQLRHRKELLNSNFVMVLSAHPGEDQLAVLIQVELSSISINDLCIELCRDVDRPLSYNKEATMLANPNHAFDKPTYDVFVIVFDAKVTEYSMKDHYLIITCNCNSESTVSRFRII